MFFQSVCFATFNFFYVIITILIFNSDSTTTFTNFTNATIMMMQQSWLLIQNLTMLHLSRIALNI